MKGVALAAFALVAVFLLASTGVKAKVTVTTVTMCGPNPTVNLDLAKQWIDDEGVLHVRSAPYTVDLTGLYPTTVTGLEGYNVDLTTGAVDFFGTMTAVGGLGTFDGRFSGTFPAGPETAFTGQATLHGDAGLLTSTFEYPSAACASEGGMAVYLTLLTPSG